MTSIRRTLGAAGALVVLTGCGSSFADEPAADIEKAATTDMKAVKSLHLSGEVTTQSEEVTLDLTLTDEGNCEGEVGIQGGTAQIISLDGESWFKADDAFWEASAGQAADQIIKLVGDKWVVQPGDESFAAFCDLDTLLKELGSDDSEDADAKKQEDTEEIDGQEAVVLDSETDDGDPLTAWVSVDDPHHILQLEVTEGEEPGKVTFSAFDEDVAIEPPAEEDTIDLSKLAG
ncbi:MAG: hypothetical protein ACRDOM_06825 [Nocardioides sp.]